jgi:hypothetical protein
LRDLRRPTSKLIKGGVLLPRGDPHFIKL